MNRLFIDSDDRLSPSSYSNGFYKSSEITRETVSKIGVNYVHMRYNIPTINSRNNVIEFFSTSSGLNHSVTLADGYYDPVKLMALIQSALNSVTGTSGLSFLITLILNSNNTFLISASGGDFRFLYTNKQNSQVYRGKSCSGITTMNIASNDLILVAKAFYTSYIDFLVPSLKEGQIHQNTFSSDTFFSNYDHILRQHVNINYDVYNDVIIDKEIHNIHYNNVRKRKLTEMNIKLYDEFGELLYFDGIDYLSYALEISLKIE